MMPIHENSAAAIQGALLPEAQVMRAADGALALRGSRCRACGQPVFPHTDVCPFCLGTENEDLALSGAATLYAFTQVHIAPRHWQTPYLIGYADFDCGLRLFAKLDPRADWAPGATARLHIEAVEAGTGTGEVAYRYHLGA